MDPKSFQFVLTMPGDSRLIGAVRNLAAHAASYANLGADAGRSFVNDVAAAAESAIESTDIQDAPLEFRFDGTAEAIRVTLRWSRNGSPETREIAQRLSS
jgi:hypothetical protein